MPRSSTRALAAALMTTMPLAALAAQQPTPASAMNTLTEQERAAGWRLLFDGATTAGWRGFRLDSVPTGWRAVDGALTRVGPARDIVSIQQFTDFELTLEWKLGPNGNSGIMFHVTEYAARTYETGPEMQILDDAGHADGKSPLTSAGANYGLHPAPRGVVKPVGEWNTVRLLVRGSHVEHWLNGTKVVEYELWSPEWQALVAKSKFTQWPGYGLARRGHIALQDHGDWVAFRNIKIREF